MMDTFLDEVYKLKDIIRYNTRIKLGRESVAEHSFFVAIIALHLCNKYKLDDKITFKCIIKALLHDMPEMEINDITHDVKVKLNLQSILKKCEDKYYETYYPQYVDLMCDCKDELINDIVDLADILSVTQFCRREKTLGNKSQQLDEIIYNTNNRIYELYPKLQKLLGDKNEKLDDTD